MATRVEVALVGSIEKQKSAGDMIPASELRRPYRDLTKVTLQVSEDMSLGQIARKGLMAHGGEV